MCRTVRGVCSRSSMNQGPLEGSRRLRVTGEARRSERLSSGVDDAEEAVGLERGTADESAVDVGLAQQAERVVGLDASAVEDRRLLRELGADAGEALADGGVHLLRLLVAGHLARADRPYGLIGDRRDPGPLGDDGAEGVELAIHDAQCLAGFALLQGLPDADDGS